MIETQYIVHGAELDYWIRPNEIDFGTVTERSFDGMGGILISLRVSAAKFQKENEWTNEIYIGPEEAAQVATAINLIMTGKVTGDH